MKLKFNKRSMNKIDTWPFILQAQLMIGNYKKDNTCRV